MSGTYNSTCGLRYHISPSMHQHGCLARLTLLFYVDAHNSVCRTCVVPGGTPMTYLCLFFCVCSYCRQYMATAGVNVLFYLIRSTSIVEATHTLETAADHLVEESSLRPGLHTLGQMKSRLSKCVRPRSCFVLVFCSTLLLCAARPSTYVQAYGHASTRYSSACMSLSALPRNASTAWNMPPKKGARIAAAKEEMVSQL